ncbi:DUF2382 domain-containing protein [Trichocoleus sp. FACHB-262]|uniref:DUF2382 domain-containing protein n=1 Tax=Trichocoleus sp. FACHB-262 TaxID=2692869 RepID=UPI0016870DF0|nr:DUF2382 domain-containing protein [Trichocoleus sp. FACHB-262]MBD2124689.1 DUF2382 domain-containing protein [Trichocoleus sp. FACHB-262]
MALYKLDDYYPNYRQELFDGNDVKGLDVYTESDEKVGSIHNVLVDDEGHFRYLVVDTGFWVFGKKVLLPVGRFRSDPQAQRIYTIGLTKQQAENLPEYHDNLVVDYDYEERVRGVYRPASLDASTPLEASAPLEASLPLENTYAQGTTYRTASAAPVERSAPVERPAVASARPTYDYRQEPALYNMNERDHQTIQLYEERLVANKHRRKAGEVAVGKHVETETARVAVPVERERIVIERTNPTNLGTSVTPGTADFREGEIARMEVYEETADVHKEAFVREQVNIRKEVERDTVTAEDQIRREELDIDTQGRPIRDNRPGSSPRDRR